MGAEQRQTAMIRAANALTRALGGATVTLRVVSSATEGWERELGVTPAEFQEMELSPVVLRHKDVSEDGRARVEMLVSVHALDALMPACGMADAMEFLKRVRSIASGGRVFVVTGISAQRFAGVEYLYRLSAVE
jgi:hypothetical protein